MTIRIRPLAADDYAAAVRLWSSVPGVRGLETREEYERILARNLDLGSAAVDDSLPIDQSLIGAVLATHDGRRGYLYHLAVAEAYRRRGIARMLVERSLIGLANEGISRCSIFLIHDNEEGAAFWLKNGWRERTDLKLMAIDLDAPR